MKEKVLNAIIEYIQLHGYPPTIREIGDAVGLKSTSMIYHYLAVLFKEKKLETDAGSGASRAIRVPGYKFVPEEAPPAAGV